MVTLVRPRVILGHPRVTLGDLKMGGGTLGE